MEAITILGLILWFVVSQLLRGIAAVGFILLLAGEDDDSSSGGDEPEPVDPDLDFYDEVMILGGWASPYLEDLYTEEEWKVILRENDEFLAPFLKQTA